jgi:hypothetical protein
MTALAHIGERVAALDGDRFVAELRRAAAVQHPALEPPLEVGTREGRSCGASPRPPPTALGTIRSGVPRSVGTLVLRMLERVPEDRPTMARVRDELRPQRREAQSAARLSFSVRQVSTSSEPPEAHVVTAR